MFNFTTLSGEVSFEAAIAESTLILQNELDWLQQKYSIAGLKIRFDFNLDLAVIGKSDVANKTIVLNPHYIVEKNGLTIVQALYHEFRHYWQWICYPEIYRWWLCRQNRYWYKVLYQYKFCSIEEDARIFGEYLGLRDRQDLLEFYSVEDLESLKADKRQLALAVKFVQDNF